MLPTVARGPVPRNRLTTPMTGGGQAPALRLKGDSVFSVARGPVPRDHLTTPTAGRGQAPALRSAEELLLKKRGRGTIQKIARAPHKYHD